MLDGENVAQVTWRTGRLRASMSASLARRARAALRGAARCRARPAPLARRTLSTANERDVLLGAAQLFEPESAWHTRLAAAAHGERRTRRVVIVGAASSGTAQVVDALLAEPHHAPVSAALAARSEAAARRPAGLRIAYGDSAAESAAHTHGDAPTDTLRIPLPWLQSGTELVELLGT